ncbi:MAG: hypothetical protein IPJ76_16935 [Flavobacteriales bacterium]|nr:MAG: hypothetical protein IPJ76_16935 [Flavobacteriales bacterium]
MATVAGAHGQQLLDDFARANGTVVGGGWTEGGIGSSGAILSNALDLPTGGLNGADWVSQDVSGLYNTVLNTNTCVLTWQFNMRTSRADPSGFAAGNYGNAFILAGSALNPATGTGYAVVHGEALTNDRLRLIRYSAGVATNTTIITGTTDFGNEYLAVRVVYTPSTNTWQMYSASGAGFPAPASAAFQEGGNVVDATYTGVNLPFAGCYFQHNTAAADRATFDNVYVPFDCSSTIATFASSSSSNSEAAGTVTVNINLSAAATVNGTYTVTVANGAGATYGPASDYTTVPAVAASTISVPVSIGDVVLGFDVVVNDDVVTEANEVITFTLTSASAGLYIGASTTHAFTIVDNDITPTVTFATVNVNAVENAGSITFQLNVSPAPTAAGSVDIFVSNGAGVTYGAGNDYTTTPGTVLSQFTVNIPIGATSVSFTANINDDAVIESTESVGFSILAVSAGYAIGASTSATLVILDNDSPPTALQRGDLVIVGVNANTNACGGGVGDDEVSFFCFKDITTGTTIDITDNGYERCNAGLWGNNEGTVRASRIGPTIPRGTVITFRFTATGVYSSLAPDASWGFTNLNGGGNVLNMNSGGDQLFFGQAGVWGPGGAGLHNATYSGTWLFGFSSYAAFPWSASCATNPTQRSNLPFGMDCFSMAPTSATDFAKYTGPQTVATQRDWILRIEDPANWTTYGTCGAYNAGGTNWLTAPVMPITLGGMVNGLWTGAKTTDWFQCQNWDDAEVPIATSNVVINSTAIRDCVVGIAAGSTGVCASLYMGATNATGRTLTIQNASTLNVGGNTTVQRTLGTGAFGITLFGLSTLNVAGNLSLQGPTAGLYEGYLRNEIAGNTVNVTGNVTIQNGGLLDLQGPVAGGSINVGGNWLNNHGAAAFNELFSTVTLNGGGAQTINTSGFAEEFGRLRINKTANDATLLQPLLIRTDLNLVQGRLFTDATNLPTVIDGATATSASDASFVHGPIIKLGNDDFTFPVGKGTQYRYARITGLTSGLTDGFRGEYFPGDPEALFGPALEPTLDHISNCEYWMIDREVGTPNAFVTLSWDNNSCGVTAMPDLRVARWDALGTIWRDRGNGGTTGTIAAGDVITAAQQNLFSPWTLASINANNPLPIELLAFNALPNGSVVDVRWSTATEINNEWFDVERSANGEDFTSIGRVAGAINSQNTLNYAFVDGSPLGGTSFYRLRQTDLDGSSTTSNVVAVQFGSGPRPLVLIGAGEELIVQHGFKGGSTLRLFDASGRMVFNGQVPSDGAFSLDLSTLGHGAYVLQMTDGVGSAVGRFVR